MSIVHSTSTYLTLSFNSRLRVRQGCYCDYNTSIHSSRTSIAPRLQPEAYLYCAPYSHVTLHTLIHPVGTACMYYCTLCMCQDRPDHKNNSDYNLAPFCRVFEVRISITFPCPVYVTTTRSSAGTDATAHASLEVL